jgi:hypothetical protein
VHRTSPRLGAPTPIMSARPGLAWLAAMAVLASLVVATPASATDQIAGGEIAAASEPMPEPAATPLAPEATAPPATPEAAPAEPAATEPAPVEAPAEPAAGELPASTPPETTTVDEEAADAASDPSDAAEPDVSEFDAAEVLEETAAAPAPPIPSVTNNAMRCGYTWNPGMSTNYFTASTTWQGVCLTDGTISDASTATKSDAFDGFGSIQLRDADTGWSYVVTADDLESASFKRGTLRFTDRDIQVPGRAGTVDAIVTVTLVASWATWNVRIVESGTMTPAPVSLTFSGNLGSDHWTQWHTVQPGTYVSTDGGASYDPVLIHTGATDGTAELRTDGYDGVIVDVTASAFEFAIGLLEYCGSSSDTLTVAAEIGENIAQYYNTDLTPLYTAGCHVATLPLREYVIGEPVDEIIEFALAGTFDWSAGGALGISSTVPGLTFEEVGVATPGVVPSVRVHGTPLIAGSTTGWFELEDSSRTYVSGTLRIAVFADAPANLAVAPITASQGVAVDTTLSLTTTGGWNWARGGEATVTGLPAGLTAVVSGENTTGAQPTIRISGVPHFNGISTASVTVATVDDSVVTELAITVGAPKGHFVIDFGVAIGEQVAGGTVGLYGSGLTAASAWDATVRSTPIVIASGTVGTNGQFASSATLPSGLAAGWHSLTLAATAADGSATQRVLWFEVSAVGTLLSVSDAAPVVTNEGNGGSGVAVTALQVTGSESSPALLIGGLLMAAGLALTATTRIRRRLTVAG